MSATGAMPSKEVVQVAVVVRDIERAAKAYARVFGVEVPAVRVTDTADKSNIRYRGQATEGRAKLAFISMGQVALELIEPVGGPSIWQEFLDQQGEGVHHIAFRVPDMDQALTALAEQGIPTVQRGDFTGGCYGYADARPALGVILELLASTPK